MVTTAPAVLRPGRRWMASLAAAGDDSFPGLKESSENHPWSQILPGSQILPAVSLF